ACASCWLALFLKCAALLALCSSDNLIFGFLPNRYGCREQSGIGHNSTSLAEPQQQSGHLARIALIGVSIYSPPHATQKRFVSTLLVNFSQSSGAALRSALVS